MSAKEIYKGNINIKISIFINRSNVFARNQKCTTTDIFHKKMK